MSSRLEELQPTDTIFPEYADGRMVFTDLHTKTKYI